MLGNFVVLTAAFLSVAFCASVPGSDWEVAASVSHVAYVGGDYVSQVELAAGSTFDIRNVSGKRVGYVEGVDIRNPSGKRLGYIDGNDIRDTSGKRLGYVEGVDIRNASGKRLGYVDGRDIRDTSGKRVGYVEGGASRVQVGAVGLLLFL